MERECKMDVKTLRIDRLRFWTSTVSLQVGVQRYGREDGRKRKKKSKDGHGDRLKTDRQRQTYTDKKEMDIPGPQARDCRYCDINRRQRLQDKRQLTPFSGLLSHPRQHNMLGADVCL